MAKTKWIVPAVALMLCAVSLIGAGYAAYTATLTDSETVPADNNFVVLSLGTTSMQSEVNIYYNSTVDYTNHANPVSKYYPTLDNGQSNALVKVLVGSFTVSADVTNKGDEVSVNGYTLALENFAIEGNILSDAALNAYRTYSAGAFSDPVTASEMVFGTTYYLALEYQQTGEKDALNAAPDATANITFDIKATANIANAA